MLSLLVFVFGPGPDWLPIAVIVGAIFVYSMMLTFVATYGRGISFVWVVVTLMCSDIIFYAMFLL